MTFSPVKAGRGDDAHTHLVHELVHFGVVAFVLALRNPVELQGAGGRSAALVERGDEARLGRHLRHHLVVGHGGDPPLLSRCRSRGLMLMGARDVSAASAKCRAYRRFAATEVAQGAVYRNALSNGIADRCLVIFRQVGIRSLAECALLSVRARRSRRLERKAALQEGCSGAQPKEPS